MTEMTQASEYDLAHIKITSHKGVEVDLKNLMQEIDIYGALGALLSGAILIVDGLNTLGNLPILGGEKVSIKYRTAGRQNFTEVNLVVGSIGDRHPTHNRTQAYWLNLVSPETYQDANTCVSQAFTGTYEDMVKKVPGLLGSSRPIATTSTVGTSTFISPQWSPLRIANWAAERATDDTASPFFFWEDVDGFHFKSLGHLQSQESAIEYFYEPKNMTDEAGNRDMLKRFLNIQNYQIERSNDRLTQNRRGVLGQTLETFDIRRKKLGSASKSCATSGIDKYGMYDDKKGSRNKVGFALTQPDNSQMTTFERYSKRELLRNVVLMGTIAGDCELKLGSKVIVKLPSMEAQDSETQTLDPLLAGDFLLTAWKQTMSKQQFQMSIELSKDSFSTKPI